MSENLNRMSSVIAGYEYDIFISYRHKDNKYDGWVSEFVSNLRKEIEATFKEDISIYFDENSYDGLLENHQVDESLRKKLHCLIFIPIISQTYCDEKSFAWQNEFLLFLKDNSDNIPGLKIDLPNGNVGSRILPIRIHEIDQEDRELIERHLGGPMRSIDFIYRSAGVNRPLRPKDDDLRSNEVQLIYRNQVNKVANAIKGLISGIRTVNDGKTSRTNDRMASTPEIKTRTKKAFALTAVIVLLLSLGGYAGYFYFKNNSSRVADELDKSIAIIPFRDLSPDKSQQYFGDGVAEMIRTNLSRISELGVTSGQSVIQYRDSQKTVPEIGQELNVSYVLNGSILKEGNSIRVIVQLIETGKDRYVWSETYDRDLEEIFHIQTEIAQKVVAMLKLKLTDREKQGVNAPQETPIQAYEYVLAGQYTFTRLGSGGDDGYTNQAITQFNNALQLDSLSVEALAGLGRAFYAKAYFGEGQHWLDSAFAVAQKILRVNPDRAEGYSLLGRVYYDKSDQQKAKINLEKAIALDPNDIRSLNLLSYIYKEERNFKMGIPLAIKVARLSPSGNNEARAQFIRMGNILFEGGYFDLAEQAWQKQTVLYPDDFGGPESLIFLKLIQGDYQEAKQILDDRLKTAVDLNNVNDVNRIIDHAWLYYLTRDYDKAQRYYLAVEKLDSMGFEEGIHTHIYKHRLAHIYKIKGETSKGEKLMNDHLSQLEQTIKEGKSRFGLEYDLAGAYAFIGNKEKAYYWLEKLPYNMLLSMFIQIDPMFDSIRNEARFKKVLEKQYADREAIRKVIETEKVQQDLKLVLR